MSGRYDAAAMDAATKSLRDEVDRLTLALAAAEQDRDEWRECSRDWRQRAERAEAVERILRTALKYEAELSADESSATNAAKALSDADAVASVRAASGSSRTERDGLVAHAAKDGERRGIRRAAWLVRTIAVELAQRHADRNLVTDRTGELAVRLDTVAAKIEELSV